jgi:hypothetical protein
LALGWGTALLFGYDQQTAVLVGLILAATSVSISAQTLMELKALRSRVGFGLLGAAVFDDILVILLLSAFIAVLEGASGWMALGSVFLRMVVFLAAASAFGLWILPRLALRVSRLRISQAYWRWPLWSPCSTASRPKWWVAAAITGVFLVPDVRSQEWREALELDAPSLTALRADLRQHWLQADLSTLAALWFTLARLGWPSSERSSARGGARLAGFSWRERAAARHRHGVARDVACSLEHWRRLGL